MPSSLYFIYRDLRSVRGLRDAHALAKASQRMPHNTAAAWNACCNTLWSAMLELLVAIIVPGWGVRESCVCTLAFNSNERISLNMHLGRCVFLYTVRAAAAD